MKNMLLRSLGVATVVVLGLTFADRKFNSDAFFYLLYPGTALGLMITGAHGGTRSEETIALILGFVVNILAYALLCRAILSAREKWRGRAASS
jgi:hypothetical protein